MQKSRCLQAGNETGSVMVYSVLCAGREIDGGVDTESFDFCVTDSYVFPCSEFEIDTAGDRARKGVGHLGLK